MKELKKAQMGMIAILTVMLVSIKRRLPEARRLSSGITTLALAGIVLLVAAGSVSAGACPAPGNTVITTSCELDRDWDVPAGENGYIIGADNIVIDGNGHYINGSIAGGVCGVPNEGDQPAGICNYNATVGYYGYSNVTIKNLEVKNFCTGILVRGATATNKVENNTIFRCNIHDNGDSASEMNTFGIHFFKHVYNSTIDECEVHHNIGGVSAMACDSGGMGIRLKLGCKHNDIIQNYVHDNLHSGIYTKGGCKYNYVAYNNITGNGLSSSAAPCGGIMMRCKSSNNWTIEMNNITDNFGPGMYVGGDYNKIRYNTVMDCKDGGELVYGHAISVGRGEAGTVGYNELYNNTFCNNNTGVTDIYLLGAGSGANNIGDNNAADTCDGCGTNGNSILYPYTCANKVSAYFDYDGDGCYSNDPANCACGIVGGGKCACCNPGMFNSTHAGVLNSTSPAIVWLTAGDDINDCDPSICTAVNWYCDGDGDTYNSNAVSGSGAPGDKPAGCSFTPGTDCNDTNSAVNPGATEICNNGVDDDCDGLTDCDDPYCKPDLDITVKEEEWINDTYYNVNYTVCNIGICGAGASNTSIYIDGTRIIVEDPVGPLTQNDCYTHTVGPFLWLAPSDNVTVCADNGGQVDEKNETNNCEINTLNYRAVGIKVGDPYPAPNNCVNGIFCVDINVTPNGLPVYGVQYKLTYNASVIYVLSQDEGTFLSHNGNQTAETRNYLDTVSGYSEYGLTRINSLLGETTPGTLVKVKYKTIGNPLDCGNINLSEVVVSDNNALPIDSTLENNTVCICPANQAPDANCSVDHKYNNAGYGMTTFNGTESTDDADLLNHFFTWQTHTHTGNLLGMVVDDFYDVSCYNGTCYDPFWEYLYLTDEGGLLDTCTCEVIVYIAGDANGDCKVNILDASMTGLRWMKTCDTYTGVCWGMLPDADMADRADLNNDCVVNILDTSIVGLNWGDTCSGTC